MLLCIGQIIDEKKKHLVCEIFPVSHTKCCVIIAELSLWVSLAYCICPCLLSCCAVAELLKGRRAGIQQCSQSHMLGRPSTAERVLAQGGVRRSWHVHNDHSSASRTSGLPKSHCRCFTKFALSLSRCSGGVQSVLEICSSFRQSKP